MAIHVYRINVAAPTLNAITLGAGGSLVVGTPYYYRVIALRVYASRYALSAASAEQSVTPTSGNQTAQLSWPAVTNATAYIIQRTTTSGSYPVEGANTFNLNGQSYAGYPYATTQTSLSDDGGAATNVRFNSNNLDFATEHALIEVYADAISEVITLWDIASALAGGGFNDLQLLGTSSLQAGTYWRDQGAYILRGFLYIRDCTYQQRGVLLGLPGALVIKSDSVIVQMGHATTNYSPVYLHMGLPRVPYTSNNNTYAGSYAAGFSIYGKSSQTNIVRLLLERPLVYNNPGNYVAIASGKGADSGDYYRCSLIDALTGLGVSSGLGYRPDQNSLNNIIESAHPIASSHVTDTIFRLGDYVSLYWGANQTLKRCTTRNLSIADAIPWYNYQSGTAFIDHSFKAKNQVDNQPYLYIYKFTGDPATAIFSVTRNFLILDSNSAVQGAVITALNASGLSAFWGDSLATFSTALDAATNPASLTVSDGTKFSVNDYIRCECYGECLKVTNIAGNVLTVARAQLGTVIRKTQTGNNNRVLKMAASKTTDADGKVTCAEPTLQREIYSVSGSLAATQNYEDTLITASWLGRNFYGPYVLTIAKAGYADYVEEKFLDPAVEKYPLGPATLEVGLSVVPPPVYVNVPGGEMEITLAAPALLEVASEAAAITVELSDG